MHVVGEKVVYGSSGIMEIVDVREEVVGGSTKKYYILHELSSSTESQIYVPVDNEKLVGAMKPLLTADEAARLLTRVSSIPLLKWNKDNRVRSEKFRKIIDSGDREDIISLMKTVYENGKRRREEGKKNYLADESFLKRAERIITSELSVVLGITEEEALSLLQSECDK